MQRPLAVVSLAKHSAFPQRRPELIESLGFSRIFGPDGKELVPHLSPGEEGLLFADIDLNAKAIAKHNLDIVGHYSRPDLLSLRVTDEASWQVHFWKPKL